MALRGVALEAEKTERRVGGFLGEARKSLRGCRCRQDLVAEDAMREGWPYEVLQDEGTAVRVAVDRVEGYERAAKRELAADAVKAAWQKYWRLA